jgi:Flp pilus assembly pilin Flp
MNRSHLILGKLALRALELRRSASRQQGQALIEYALIVSLVAVRAIVSLRLAGTNISGILHTIAGEA